MYIIMMTFSFGRISQIIRLKICSLCNNPQTLQILTTHNITIIDYTTTPFSFSYYSLYFLDNKALILFIAPLSSLLMSTPLTMWNALSVDVT
jgi:hypothetical protein